MAIFKGMQDSNEQILSLGFRNPVSQALKGWLVSETLEVHNAFMSTLKIIHGTNTPTKACFINLSQAGKKDNSQN